MHNICPCLTYIYIFSDTFEVNVQHVFLSEAAQKFTECRSEESSAAAALKNLQKNNRHSRFFKDGWVKAK